MEGYHSNFANLDLSAFKINGNKAIEGEPMELSGCILTNTGIRIDFDTKRYKSMSDKYKYFAISSSDSEHESPITIKKVFNDYWGGCYLNGRRISTVEERRETAKKKRLEYEQMKEDLLSTTKSSIKEQAKVFTKNV